MTSPGVPGRVSGQVLGLFFWGGGGASIIKKIRSSRNLGGLEAAGVGPLRVQGGGLKGQSGGEGTEARPTKFVTSSQRCEFETFVRHLEFYTSCFARVGGIHGLGRA